MASYSDLSKVLREQHCLLPADTPRRPFFGTIGDFAANEAAAVVGVDLATPGSERTVLKLPPGVVLSGQSCSFCRIPLELHETRGCSRIVDVAPLTQPSADPAGDDVARELTFKPRTVRSPAIARASQQQAMSAIGRLGFYPSYIVERGGLWWATAGCFTHGDMCPLVAARWVIEKHAQTTARAPTIEVADEKSHESRRAECDRIAAAYQAAGGDWTKVRP